MPMLWFPARRTLYMYTSACILSLQLVSYVQAAS